MWFGGSVVGITCCASLFVDLYLTLSPPVFLFRCSMPVVRFGPGKAAGWSASLGGPPPAGQMLSKYRVCLRASATVHVSAVFLLAKKNTCALQSCVAVLQARNWSSSFG